MCSSDLKISRIDSGSEEWIDYGRVMEILLSAGFNGTMSIVYEDQGNACGPHEAIALAVSHLREVIAAGVPLSKNRQQMF